MKEQLEKLKQLVFDIEKDQEKLEKNKNFSASLRMRKNLQEVKKVAQDYRGEILKFRNSDKNG